MEKLILISGCYENHCENRFTDSRQISSPALDRCQPSGYSLPLFGLGALFVLYPVSSVPPIKKKKKIQGLVHKHLMLALQFQLYNTTLPSGQIKHLCENARVYPDLVLRPTWFSDGKNQQKAKQIFKKNTGFWTNLVIICNWNFVGTGFEYLVDILLTYLYGLYLV